MGMKRREERVKLKKYDAFNVTTRDFMLYVLFCCLFFPLQNWKQITFQFKTLKGEVFIFFFVLSN